MDHNTDSNTNVTENVSKAVMKTHLFTREQWDGAAVALDHLLAQPAKAGRSTLVTELATLLPKIRQLRAKGHTLGEIAATLKSCGISVSEATLRRVERDHPDGNTNGSRTKAKRRRHVHALNNGNDGNGGNDESACHERVPETSTSPADPAHSDAGETDDAASPVTSTPTSTPAAQASGEPSATRPAFSLDDLNEDPPRNELDDVLENFSFAAIRKAGTQQHGKGGK